MVGTGSCSAMADCWAAPIAVCMKWVSTRPEVDPFTGAVTVDDRWSGASPADNAALECALRIAESLNPRRPVVVVTVAGESADAMLRDALAAGADRVIRIDPHGHGEPGSASVAVAIADVLAPLSPAIVLCGDGSLDRGSASVPPFIAAELGIGQACGLVRLDAVTTDAVAAQTTVALRAERRLDGGRREVIEIAGRAVLSVEGGVATLRRAPLRGVLAAASAEVEAVRPGRALVGSPAPIHTGPFRPRARILDGPATALTPRARVEALTGALVDRTPPKTLVLDPDAAADAILSQLAEWGYLAAPAPSPSGP